MTLLGRMLYPYDQSPIDTMFTKILVDPSLEQTDAGSIVKEKTNTPRFAEETSELLGPMCMEIYELFKNGLHETFANYVYENVAA
jgi:hypothetical protein